MISLLKLPWIHEILFMSKKLLSVHKLKINHTYLSEKLSHINKLKKLCIIILVVICNVLSQPLILKY